MDKTDVAAFIESSVDDHTRITGSKLSELLRAAFPEWAPETFGAKTLSDFIAQNAPAITVVSRAGLDNVYGLASQADALIATQEPANLWRTWVSPNSSHVLEVRLRSGEVAAVDKHEVTRDGWVRPVSPTVEQHRQLARDFLAFQFPDGDEVLDAITREPGAWWQSWMAHIRRLNLANVWREFRTSRLVSLFDSSLSASSLENDARRAAVTLLSYLASPESVVASIPQARPVVQSKSELRKLAMHAVEMMSEDELSQLRLPLGTILKVIRAQKQ